MIGVAAVNRALLSRRVLLTLGAVLAIVAGLLAMHSLNLHEEHAASAATSAHQHAEAPAQDCGGACGGEQSTAAAACILALLVLVLVFGVLRTSSGAPHALRWVARMGTPVVPEPAPPSLLVLSISRT